MNHGVPEADMHDVYTQSSSAALLDAHPEKARYGIIELINCINVYSYYSFIP